MLEAEMNKNSLDFVAEKKVLWRAWSRTMINPHPFGFYSEKILMDKEKRKQFLKDIDLTLKNIKKVDTKLLDTKYSNDWQIQIQPAATAAGGSLSKKRKKNKSKKQIKKQKKKKKKKTTYKNYYRGGRHNNFNDDTTLFTNVLYPAALLQPLPASLIRPLPEENYNPINNPPIKRFLQLAVSPFLPNMYAMQIPNLSNELNLKQMFMYLMYTMEIDYLIDLQACNLPRSNIPHKTVPTRGCNEHNLNIEMETWLAIKNLFPDTRNNPNIGSTHIPYLDMTSGSFDAWNMISLLPDMNTNKSVIHCLAGFGRTSSIIIYLTLRDNVQYRNYVGPHMNLPYWGLNPDAWRAFISQMLINQLQINEFWDMKDEEAIRRVVTRINLIIYYLAIHWSINPVVAYNNFNFNSPVSVDLNILRVGLELENDRIQSIFFPNSSSNS